MALLDIGFQDIQTIGILVGIISVVLFGLIFYLMTELKSVRREIGKTQPKTVDHSLLCLQAYERLTLLADRISLKNLVSRMHSIVLTGRELQAAMIETIKGEYEHNITQQNYVNPEVWKAITNMKDQNIYIINQLASILPNHASSMDLSKVILEYTSQNTSDLGAIVLDAIQFEVKKLV